jgi:hypothetical protein
VARTWGDRESKSRIGEIGGGEQLHHRIGEIVVGRCVQETKSSEAMSESSKVKFKKHGFGISCDECFEDAVSEEKSMIVGVDGRR